MVTVNATSSQPATTVASTDNPMADFDTFLQLLTAQLKNQDPLDPSDGTEFTSQLAQFSQLEQQINTNENLKDLISLQPDNKHSEAMSYLGKDVLVPGNMFVLDSSKNVEFSYQVSDSLDSANAYIYNSEGDKVREFSVNGDEGLHEILWDGRDSDGNMLPEGTYSVKIEGVGKDENGDLINPPLTSYFFSTAEKVTKLGDSYAIHTGDGRTIKLEEVMATRGTGTYSGSYSNTNNHSTALQMLGKQALIKGDTFEYDGNNMAFTYGLTQTIHTISITISDEEGNRVLQVPFNSSEGSHEYIWDGKDSSGKDVPNGKYTMQITGQKLENDEIIEQNIDAFYYGKVDKIESQDGVVVVYTDDGRTAFFNDVIATKE